MTQGLDSAPGPDVAFGITNLDELPHPIAHLRRPTQLVAPLHQRTLNSEAPKEGETCAAFLERAVDFSSSHGVTTDDR